MEDVLEIVAQLTYTTYRFYGMRRCTFSPHALHSSVGARSTAKIERVPEIELKKLTSAEPVALASLMEVIEFATQNMPNEPRTVFQTSKLSHKIINEYTYIYILCFFSSVLKSKMITIPLRKYHTFFQTKRTDSPMSYVPKCHFSKHHVVSKNAQSSSVGVRLCVGWRSIVTCLFFLAAPRENIWDANRHDKSCP